MFQFLRVAASRVRAAFLLRRVDHDFEQELSTHLDMLTQENIRQGMSPEEARREAHIRLGGITQLRETNRSLQGLPVLETLLQDLRYAFRMLLKKPGFTAIAVLTLALGIGANTAIFSVVDAIFLRPLPFPNANRIYVIRRIDNPFGGASLSMPMFLAWQKHQGLFDHLALFSWRSPSTLTGAGEPERISSAGASTELFSALGVQPVLGRDFNSEEGRAGGPNVVILSYRLWQDRFQADRNVLGKILTLDSEAYTVIGVLPSEFQLPGFGAENTDLWLPIRVPFTSNNPSNGSLRCLGLLKSGVTPSQAEAALTPPLSELRRQFPNMFGPHERARLQPLRSFIASSGGPVPLLLFGAVTLVLLIACANVANLMLAAATGRQREMAIRTAVGAGRSRIVRQLLTESVLLAILGGVAGVTFCYAAFDVIVSLVPRTIAHVGPFRIDGYVLLFAFALSVVTGILFGLAPALGASRLDLNVVLKKANSNTGSGRHARLRSLLAMNEVAISLVLLVGAALALESLARLMSVPPGFRPEQLLTFYLDLPGKKYDSPARRIAFFDQALDRMSALPGVERVAMVNSLPLQGGSDTLFSIEDGVSQQKDHGAANYRAISADYFAALGIPIERGRIFASGDNTGSTPVAVINHAMANSFWPDDDPIGHHIWIGKPMGPANSEAAPRLIIGIAGNIRERSLADPPEPTMYVPYKQRQSADGGFFLLRTTRSPSMSVADARAALHSLDPEIPLTRPRPMIEVVSASMIDWRFQAILLGTFGGLALFIAAIGVYGVISYSVAHRTQEIGVRMALGALHQNVLGMVLWQGMRMALAGITIGLVASYALTRLMSSLLYGVSATDPLTFAGVALLLAIVALVACYLPARRAMRVDPMIALRYE